jgi:hypothetical protein
MQAINNPMRSKRVVSIFMRTSQHPEGGAGTATRDNLLEAIPKLHLTADGPPQADCTPLKSAHNLLRLLRFFIGGRLALSCDLLFLRWLLSAASVYTRFLGCQKKFPGRAP